ncbi:MAG: hypothetical protein IKP65_01875 [Alphaproteobacteria bacterium]|nr:hypothetical protein [Alphaproteobacteria bacterium]MBR4315708.1 hypothetical protein [Alphaproteobacteria bacterium]
MKEKLSNSLQLLSDSVTELEQSFLAYKKVKSQDFSQEVEFYKENDEKNRIQIDNLKHSLLIEQSKVRRAIAEIHDLSISLKNKINKF